jgi:hypothetical protein
MSPQLRLAHEMFLPVLRHPKLPKVSRALLAPRINRVRHLVAPVSATSLRIWRVGVAPEAPAPALVPARLAACRTLPRAGSRRVRTFLPWALGTLTRSSPARVVSKVLQAVRVLPLVLPPLLALRVRVVSRQIRLRATRVRPRSPPRLGLRRTGSHRCPLGPRLSLVSLLKRLGNRLPPLLPRLLAK